MPLSTLNSSGSTPSSTATGRTGRLVLNLLLVRLGYPPAIIYQNQRISYLRALGRSEAGENDPLGELIARAILDNLYKLASQPSPALPGWCRPPPWRSTRNWVDEYLASRHRRA